MKKILVVALSIVVALGITSCGKGKKADYPKKGVTMICPWGAGGGTDAILRAVCSSAEKYLGTTITVENKTGGAGSIGYRAIKDAKPDGYTIGMITFELSSNPWQGLQDFTYEAYDPLLMVNTDAATITVKGDAPYNTLAEFVDYCKKNPGKVNIGNSAPGSVWHIAAGLFASQAGIDVKHVPFEGAAGAVTAVAGGHIEAVSVSLAEVKSQLDAGNVKVLAIMDSKRPVAYPNIPTMKELGYDIEYGTWRGIGLPKGISKDIKDKLFDVFTKAMNDPDFIAAAKKLNQNITYMDSEVFAAFLKTNYEGTGATMKKLGLVK
ncbi:Bug family tripartite tricarboxylate transporter substrate binding protein [Treponema pectinovorum]|uniref:Bug family tripartite tricarboxylate transporter substrate binding protein n=1 Tax=Treponema pectinovorum TaxID=164 RepID=UPI0011CB0CF7|nr:tripartite tricarboxylate transporter substrate binding protein [Treponema pectinovorum]